MPTTRSFATTIYADTVYVECVCASYDKLYTSIVKIAQVQFVFHFYSVQKLEKKLNVRRFKRRTKIKYTFFCISVKR